MRTRIRLLLFLVCITSGLFATDLRFTNLGVLQGLSSAGVNVIYNDSRGFTWIGTQNGLNRFDGETFVIYSPHFGDSTTLPGENIQSITEDAAGNLWIGTDRGIARFNPWNGKSETIKLAGDNKGNGNRFSVITTYDGQVWACTAGRIWKYDRQKNVFVSELSCDGKNGHPARPSDIYEDRQHRLWICTYDGVYLFDRASKKTEHFRPDGDASLIINMYQDHSGKLWCAAWGKGIALFDPAAKQFHFRKWEENPAYSSASNVAVSLTETVDKNQYTLWAATNNGLAQVEYTGGADFTFQFVKHDATDPESILSNQVNSVTGNGKQLWVATSGGISILLPGQQAFRDYAKNFQGQTIRIVHEQDNGNFFCTWYGNGLQKADANGNIIRSWKSVPENKELDCGQVSDVVRDKNGELWVATFGGLAHGDKEGNHFTQLLPDLKNPGAICDKRITCVTVAQTGAIVCGSYGKGISVIDPATHRSVNYKHEPKNPNSLPDDLVWEMFSDENLIWIGTNNGVASFNPVTKKFNVVKYALRGKDTLFIGMCTTIFKDSESRIWLGTDNGLFCIQQNNTITSYLKEDGLADNKISAVCEDGAGNIWISTYNGLSRLDFETNKFTNFSLGNGLPVANLEGDLGVTGDGRILIGLNNRVIAFRPENLGLDHGRNIFITSISVSGNSYPFDKNPSALSGVELPWNDNVISFDFVQPGFSGNPDVKYEFQLEGADENWVSSEHRHFASYVGLPPGNYIFRCRASLGNGAWSKPAEFSFVIHPPVWKRWWFISAITLIILTMIVLIVRREATRKYREKLLILEKKQAIEIERNRISRDMHDDLGSGLTRIAILSEVVKKKINPADASQQQVNTISESARELVDNLNEIIWALNPDNDNLANLAAYIREYADRFLEPFSITLHCTIPENLSALHLSEEKRRNIFLVVKEALHNIVKHSGAKNATLIFHQDKNFTIGIKDDGKGFTKDDLRQFGNGLNSMKKRAEAIGAVLSIESEPGRGTSVKVSFT